MMCKRRKWLRGEIFLDEQRLKAFDPKVNIDDLRVQSSIFTRNDVPFGNIPVEEKYRWLTAVKSAVLQVSPSHPGLLPVDSSTSLEDMSTEFNRLFRDLIHC